MESILHSIILLGSCVLAEGVLKLSDNMRGHCLADSLKIEILNSFTDVHNVTIFVRDHKDKAYPLSEELSARCGYKLRRSYNGGLDFWVSLTACHLYLQKQRKLMLISMSVKYVPLDPYQHGATEHMYFTCPYKPSSVYRLVCEEAYIEVSRALHGSFYNSKGRANESQLQFDIRTPGSKTVTRSWAWISTHGVQLRVDHPANRITTRVPHSSPIISRKEEGYGGYQSVGYHLVVKHQDRDNFQYDMSAQCPVVMVMCEDGHVFVSVASLHLPGLGKGVQDQVLGLQLDGVMLSQEEMQIQGFALSLEKQDVQLSFALMTNPLVYMDSISINRHHLALVLTWRKQTGRRPGQAIIHIPSHSCHLQQPTPAFTVSVLEDAFNVTYGPVLAAHTLSAVSVDGVFFVSPNEAQGGIETHLLLEDNVYYVSLLAYFPSQWIPQKYLGGITSQYSIKPALVFRHPEDEELIAEGEEFTYIREDIVLPSLEGYCSRQGVCFNITHGNSDHLWVLYVWDSPFTLKSSADLQAFLGHVGHHQFCVNIDSLDLLHQSVSEQKRVLLLGIAFRDRTNKEVKVWSHQACTFPPTNELTCSVEGVVKAKGLRVASSPTARLELLTLLDPTCQPSDISHGNVSFIFTVGTCGTVKQVQGAVAVYENRVSNVKTLAEDAPEYLKFESTLMCHYRIPRLLSSKGGKSPGPGNPSVHTKGSFQFQMNIMKDKAFSMAYQSHEYPVVRRLGQPVRVEVGMRSLDPQVELYLQDCWATPTPEPEHSHTWFLIKDGCDVKEDEYRTIFHKVPLSKRIRFPQHYKHFEMKTFTFINPHSRELLQQPIYLHCTVVICDLEISNDEFCKAQCKPDQQRKGRRFRSESTPKFLLTSGSIQLVPEVHSTDTLLGKKASENRWF